MDSNNYYYLLWHTNPTDNDIGPKGAESLKKVLERNTTLEILYMDGTHDWRSWHFIALLILKLLTDNNIGDEGAKSVAEGLKRNGCLVTLDLSGSPQILESSKSLSNYAWYTRQQYWYWWSKRNWRSASDQFENSSCLFVDEQFAPWMNNEIDSELLNLNLNRKQPERRRSKVFSWCSER